MKAITIILTSFAITTGVIKAAPALAETNAPATELNVSLVRTADLDLGSSAGQRKLDQRLPKRRAKCAEPHRTPTLKARTTFASAAT